MQDFHVVAYASRKLRMHEENYSTPDLELSTVAHAKIWRHYIMERDVNSTWIIRILSISSRG
jgi:hypothetical protein